VARALSPRGGALAVGAPAAKAVHGRRNEHWSRVANAPGKVGGGETTRWRNTGEVVKASFNGGVPTGERRCGGRQ
jgi:hypothetical protein